MLCIDEPAGTYWEHLVSFLDNELSGHGYISHNDFGLIERVSRPEDAVARIRHFYSRYHSLRYVEDQLVIRMSAHLDQEHVDTLKKDFADILISGGDMHLAGPFDGGSFPQDHIANLAQFIPISFQGEPSQCQFANAIISVFNVGCRMIGSNTRYEVTNIQAEDNLVDAAIAAPLNAADVKDEIINIGPIQGTIQGELGMAVKKSGRTTVFTTGEIQQVDVTANVQYGAGQIAVFTDQLLAGAMSQGGDSGSAVLDDNNRLTGLLFAGSDTTTIINRIENVFSALGVSL